MRDDMMNDLTQKLIIAMVAVPLLVAIFLTIKEAALVTTAIAITLVFANLDKFSRFKGVGIEAELRTVVDRAYAAIDELKELGLSLSGPIVDDMAVSGRMLQYIPLTHKLERVEKIAETLRKLGATPKEIDEACATIYGRVANDHIKAVLYALKVANPGKDSLFQGLGEGKMDSWERSALDKFIKDNVLNKSAETDEWILDEEYFRKNKKLRRPERWQS